MHPEGPGPQEYRINHGLGLTITERLLKDLGERSFLRFWCHANPHVTTAKEACDLIVVCGDYVVLFSDKSVNFQFDNDRTIAWKRWYREAVLESVGQLKGATRRLLSLRSQIYKDRMCTIPLGIPMPPSDQMRLYCVAVVSLSSEVGETDPPIPFLNVSSQVKAGQHLEDGAVPFVVGDVMPDKRFVHAMDVAGLWAVLSELDTIADFANYLDARQEFIRDKAANSSVNEWCMLGRYLVSYDEEGYALPLDQANPGTTHLTNIEWQSDEAHRAFQSRRSANQVSYTWDRLIEDQAQMIESQSFEFATYNTIEEAERVVRHMALENRLNRRLLSRSWQQVCMDANPTFAARIRTIPHSDIDGTTYVFFNLGNFMNEPYDTYRAKRRAFLQKMMIASLVDVPTSKIIIGIAAEYGAVPDSYDLAHFDVVASAGEALEQDAREAWRLKKSAFEGLGTSRVDERDIPDF